VDDEKTSLKHFKNIFGEKFSVFTASSAREGLQVLEENKNSIGILMTDQRMPGETGTQVLKKVRKDYPNILRILITAYADIESTADAVNTGGIYKYVRKPWDIPQLETTLMQGLAIFAGREMRNRLGAKRFSILEKHMITDHYQSLRTFTSMLSRTLRDPVADLKLFIEGVSQKRLKEQFKKINPEASGHWEDLLIPISAQVDRMLLLLSRLDEAGGNSKHEGFHQIRIQEVVSQLIDQMKPKFKIKKIRIQNNIPEDLQPIKAVREMLDRLFSLLLEDELSSVTEGGELRFSARSIPATPGEPARLQIEIEDDGPPLCGESYEPAFEPFHIRSQDPKELGLNLWVCFFLVRYYGGKIIASNNQCGGVTFTITLPADPDEPGSPWQNDDFFQEMVWNEAIWEYLLMEKGNHELLGCVLDAYNRDH
jgi:signal transduction histidine kinase